MYSMNYLSQFGTNRKPGELKLLLETSG